MKKLGILCALVAVVLLTACGGGSGSSGETEGISGKLTVDKANQVIEYYNKSLGIFQDTYKEEDRVKVIAYMESKGRKGNGFIRDRYSARDTTYILSPGTCFEAETRTTLKEYFTVYFDAATRFSENLDKFKTYRSAEDYKDDNWKQGEAWTGENKQLWEQMQQSKAQIQNLLAPMADKAEELTLEDNPAKDQIMAAKRLFAVMEAMLEETEEQPVDMEKLEIRYAQLEALLTQAKELPAVEGQDSENRYYGYFLEEIDSFMAEVRKAKRNNKITTKDYERFLKNYNRTIEKYNRYVGV